MEDWTLDNGHWTIGSGHWIGVEWSIGHWTVDIGQWTLNNRKWTLDRSGEEYRSSEHRQETENVEKVDIGHQTQDTGHWDVDSGQEWKVYIFTIEW